MLIKLEEAKEKSKTFCLYPFAHLNFKSDGHTAPCYRALPTGLSKENDFGWNSQTMKELRKKVLNNEKHEACISCHQFEEANVQSARQNSIEEGRHPFYQWEDSLENYDHDSGTMEIGPKQIELRFSNECNFQCRMCGPMYSSKWSKLLAKNNEYTNSIVKTLNAVNQRLQLTNDNNEMSEYMEQLFTSLNKWKHNLQHVMIAGGEPLMQKEHFHMLQLLEDQAAHITLDYSTNLSVLEYRNQSIIDHWKKYQAIILRVSIDGDPFIYPYVRKYGDSRILENNIQKVHQELDHNIRNFIGTLTTSAYNVSRVVETVDYFTSLGLLYHSSQVQLPELLSSQVLPKEEKETITKKTRQFLDNIEKLMKPMWEKHPIWKKDFMREKQVERVAQHLKSIINFMNHRDESHKFKKFIDYDNLLNKDESHSIFDFYPHWKKYY